MKQLLQKSYALKAFMLIATLIMSVSGAWAGTGTIAFGNKEGSTKISGTSITGSDNLNNSWSITTVTSDPSFTQNVAYSQVGSANKPATSITFTMTLPSQQPITAFSANFGGFSGTAGTVTLKVDEETVGTGTIPSSSDVTISSTQEVTGTTLTVIVTDIAKGIKCYSISYTYGGEDDREEVTLSFPAESYDAVIGEDFTAPLLTVDPSAAASEVEFSSSNTRVATVGEDGAVTLVGTGTTTITAKIENSTNYLDVSASYTLNVTKVFAIEDGVFDFESKASDYGSGVTTGEDYIYEDKTWTAGNVTLVSSGKYRWWANDGTLRFYKAEGDENATSTSAMTISVPEGNVITNIVITGGQTFSANVGEYTSGTWTGSAQSVTLTYAANSGSVNVKTVIVTYEAGTAVEVPTPTFNPEAGEVAAGTEVEIICPAEADGVEYSFDQTNWEEFGDPIVITEATTIYARAYDTDGNYSEVVSAAYTVQEVEDGIVFDFNGLYEATQAITDVTVDGVTATFDKASGGTAPAWNFNANEARLYAGNTLTISSASKRIVKIVYTYAVHANSSGNAPTLESVEGSSSAGTWSEATTTWTGADNAVTMTLGGKAGNFGFTKIVVTLEEGATKVTPTVAIGATELEVGGTTVITTDGPALTIASDDTDVVSVSGNTLTAESAGSAVVTVTWPETDEFFGGTKTFNITVVDPNTPGSTIDNPLTVAQVLALFADNNVPTSEVYVSGIISSIKSLNTPQYKRAQYYISDDGTTTNQFYVYNGYYLDGADFTSNDQIQVGDEVIILGTLTTYSGTNEFAANNKIVYFNRPIAAVEKPTFSVEAGTYLEAQSVEITCATDGATIYYTIDGTEPTAESTPYNGAITISTTTTLKAIAIKDGNLSAVAEATYTFKTIEDGVFDFEGKFTDYGSGVTTTSENIYIYEDKTWTAGNVTLVSSGRYRWWTADGTLRFYRTDNDENATTESAMTISVPEGKVITSIVITGGQSFTANVGEYAAGTWTGSEQSVTLTLEGTSAQNVKTVTVTYENTATTLKGDVNNDKVVTIADVTALVNIILGKATPENNPEYNFEAAKVNEDDIITIADVTALVNIILGKQ